MSCVPTDRRRATGWLLSLRLGAVLGIAILGMGLIVDQLLGRSLADRDRELLKARLENYQRIAGHGELAKLYGVLDEEQQGGLLGNWLIRMPSGAIYGAGRWQTLEPPAAPGDDWVETSAGDGSRWLLGRASLGAGREILIGLDAAARRSQRVEYRWAMAALVAPIWILAVALMVYINRRTLRPIRDLIDTVETIRSSRELSARVPVRDDRSELGRLSVQVNAMLATIGQLVNGMRESLDHVAHDLRTPLARLRLNLEQQLLQPQETLTAQQIQALSESIEECGRIESMLKTLMDIAEAEYGLLQLDYQPLDGARLLREMAELYQYSAEDAGISVHLRAEGPIPLEADPNRLRQVLANLIDNAIKYTPAGGEVRLEAHAGTDAVLFRISDSGIGIAAADRPHIYQRLFRGDRSRSSKGLGLGLSLVRAIAEAHHGCVSETSAPGAGSCFEVRLPASRRRPPAPLLPEPLQQDPLQQERR